MKSFDMKLIEIIGCVLFVIGQVFILSYGEIWDNVLVIIGVLFAIFGMCCFLYYVLKEHINRLVMIHETRKLLNKIGTKLLTLKIDSVPYNETILYNGEEIIKMNIIDKKYHTYYVSGGVASVPGI